MLAGLAVTAAAALWLATRPDLGIKERWLRSQKAAGQANSSVAADAPAAQPEITAPTPAPNEPPQPNLPAQRIHTVAEGETLSSISQKYYGSARQYRKIFEANRGTIKNVDRIPVGAKLIIPD